MWVPLILVGIILGIVLLRKHNIKAPAMSVNMPQISGRLVAWVFGGIALLVAAIWLFKTNSLSNLEGLDTNLWIAVGILGALAVAGALKKGGASGTVALVLVVGGLLFFGADAPQVWKKAQTGASSMVFSESKSTVDEAPSQKQIQTTPDGRKWATMNVEWDEINPDGTIPIYIPSEIVEIPLNCTARYSERNGIDYQVLYRVIGGGWEAHRPGQHAVGAEVKFMVLRKGIKIVPYELSCP